MFAMWCSHSPAPAGLAGMGGNLHGPSLQYLSFSVSCCCGRCSNADRQRHSTDLGCGFSGRCYHLLWFWHHIAQRSHAMKMMVLLICGFLLANPTILLAAQEDIKEYGDCAVSTDHDEFTDKSRGHTLVCAADDTHLFFILCGQKNIVVLQSGLQSHAKSRIKVRYRWGKSEVQTGQWNWRAKQNVAYSFTTEIVNSFMSGIIETDRLLFQIGDNRGTITFSEAEKASIPDFKVRCSSHGKQ